MKDSQQPWPQDNDGDEEEMFARILEGLDEAEKQCDSSNGESMIRSIRGGNIRINAIPSEIPGACHTTLVVAIGDDEFKLVEVRILLALKHILLHCPKKTRKVVFWATAWNSVVWKKHREAFKNVDVYLKLYGFRPIWETGLRER